MVCDILMEHIFVRLRVPQKIVLDNATYFSSEEIFFIIMSTKSPFFSCLNRGVYNECMSAYNEHDLVPIS